MTFEWGQLFCRVTFFCRPSPPHHGSQGTKSAQSDQKGGKAISPVRLSPPPVRQGFLWERVSSPTVMSPLIS